MNEFSKATAANSNRLRSSHESTDPVAELRRFADRIAAANGERSVDDHEPIRVITVRLPRSLHLALKNEATSRQTSMNQLCITKLLLAIEEMDSTPASELNE